MERAVSARREKEPGTIRRPPWKAVRGQVVRELPKPTSVGEHGEYLEVAIAVRHEREVESAGRPVTALIDPVVRRHAPDVRPVRLHHVDVRVTGARRGEENRRAVQEHWPAGRRGI